MAKAKRAANGMGSMTYDDKRKLYTYRITIGYDENGKAMRKSFSARTQEAVMSKYEAWKEDYNCGNERKYIDMTIAEYSDKWYDSYAKRVEKSTAANYFFTLKIIKKELGNMMLVDVRARHIEGVLDRLVDEYSKSVVSKVRTMLNQILRKAEADEIINKNPVPLVQRTDYRRVVIVDNKKEKDSWTADEIATLMESLPKDKIGHSIRLMISTGIGVGELLALNKDTIAADGSWIKIVRALKLGERSKPYIGPVKAKNRIRVIPVPEGARQAAMYLYGNANYYIIEGETAGFPMHPTTYRGHFKNTIYPIKKVRLLTPHCCRHTYISHLEDADTDFAVIQALSGHSDKESTINYIHPQSESIDKAVSVMDSILRKNDQKI